MLAVRRVTPYYDDGEGIVIYHGDCRDVLPGLTADAVVTDPPYGVDFDYDEHKDERGDTYGDLLAVVVPLLMAAAPVVVVTPGIGNLWRWEPAKWVLCWYKPGSPRRMALGQPDRPQGGFNQWEPVLVYGPGRFMHDTISLPAQPQTDTGDHPCPKPLKLLRWLVAGAAVEGGTVLDPFMGSGTTLRAAKDTGRKAIGIELSERYCEIAAKRLAQGVLAL